MIVFQSERGATVLIVSAILAMTIAILTFSFMIDQPFTHAAHRKAQDALDQGSDFGVLNLSVIENGGRVATDTAIKFMSNTIPTTSYGAYSDDLAGEGGTIGQTSYRAAVPTPGCNPVSDRWWRDMATASGTYGGGGLNLEASGLFNSLFDWPLGGGGCIDDYKNAVFLYSHFRPKQFLEIPLVPSGLEISAGSAAVLKTQLLYVLVDTAMDVGSDNYPFTYGNGTFGAPILGQWPAVDVPDIFSGWNWPGNYGLLETNPYTTLPVGDGTGDTQLKRKRFLLATCNNLFWRLYLKGVVNLLDTLASSSSTNFTTYVGLIGPDHYQGQTNPPGGGGSAYPMIPWPLIGIHPSTTSTNPVASGHPFDIDPGTGFPVPGSTLFPLQVNGGPENSLGLYSPKTTAFSGFIDSMNAVPTVNRNNNGGQFFDFDDTAIPGTGGTGWNLDSLRMCAALYEMTSPHTLHPDLAYVPGEAGMDVIHHEAASELVRGGFTNWFDDAPNGSAPDLNIATTAGRSGNSESTRNLISALAPAELWNYDIDKIVGGTPVPPPDWHIPTAPTLPDTGGPTWDPLNNDMTGYDVGDFSERLDVGAANLPYSLLLVKALLVQARADYNSDADFGARRPIDSDSVTAVVFSFSPWSKTTYWRRRIQDPSLTLQNFVNQFDIALGQLLCDPNNPVNLTIAALPSDGFALNMWLAVDPVIEKYEQAYNSISRDGTVPAPPDLPAGCQTPPANIARITFLISDWQQRVGLAPNVSQQKLSAATLAVSNFPPKIVELIKKRVYIN